MAAVLEDLPGWIAALQPAVVREVDGAEPAIRMVLEAEVVDWACLKVKQAKNIKETLDE